MILHIDLNKSQDQLHKSYGERWTSFSRDKLCINIYFHPQFIIYMYFEFVFFPHI